MPGGAHVPTQTGMGRTRFSSRIVVVFGAIRATLAVWRRRTLDRRALAQMSERELSDIGVCWSAVADEVSKPFWRA